MESINSSDDCLSAEIKSKRDCLEKAKKILLTEEYDSDIKTGNLGGKSRAFVDNLTNLHDSLGDILSKSSQVELKSFSPSPKSLLELIYSQFYHVRWSSSMKGDRNESMNAIDNDMLRSLVVLEADLYRAMWLSCLILLSVVNASNCSKRRRTELKNWTNEQKSRKNVLQRTVRQCRSLVRLLERVSSRQQPKVECSDHAATNNLGDDDSKNVWDARILEWTKEEEEDEDDSLIILSFTKEELAEEEEELLNMAATPIRPVHQQQKKVATFNESTTGNAIETNIPLMGRLISGETETSPSMSPVLIKLDDHGILRATEGTAMDKDGTGGNEKDHWWWSLTSKSALHCDYNKSPNKIQINNVISIRTADLTTVTLDVGRESKLWLDQVSRIQTINKRHDRDELAGEREDMEKLWPEDEVIEAQSKARQLFVGKIREGL